MPLGLLFNYEEGRLFQSRIVLGKNKFSRASLYYRQIVLCIVIHAMPELRVRLKLGARVRYLSLSRDTSGVYLVGEGYGGPLTAGLQGWPLKFV